MSSAQAITTTPAKRRWLRFSLRGVLVLIAVIAVLIWIPIQRARSQRKAVEAIQRLGGSVDYDFRVNDLKEPPGPVWLRRLLGDDFFQTVHTIQLGEKDLADIDLEFLHALPQTHGIDLSNSHKLTDAVVAHISGLANLDGLDLRGSQLRNKTGMKALFLNDTKITDAGIASLAEMKNLWRLGIGGTQTTDKSLKVIGDLPVHSLSLANTPNISDVGLAHLRSMSKLQTLKLDDDAKTRRLPISDLGLAQLDDLNALDEISLINCAITDAAVQHLLKHTALTRLTLSGTQLTNDGLAQLKALPNLRVLYIANTAVTDAGLAQIQTFPKLTALVLNGSKITDAGIAQLAGCGKLQDLLLDDTAITDAAVPQLLKLTALGQLHLNGTQLTDAGLAQLAALPTLYLLYLKDTAVTDAGLLQLKAFPKLQSVKVGGPNMTKAGIERLHQALPQLNIHRDP